MGEKTLTDIVPSFVVDWSSYVAAALALILLGHLIRDLEDPHSSIRVRLRNRFKTQHLRELSLHNHQSERPLYLRGKVNQATKRLRFRVSCSHRSPVGQGRWSEPFTADCGEALDLMPGQILNHQLIFSGARNSLGSHLYWGGVEQNFPLASGINRAKLMIIDENGQTQEEYMEVMLYGEHHLERPIELLRDYDLDWVRSWEATVR